MSKFFSFLTKHGFLADANRNSDTEYTYEVAADIPSVTFKYTPTKEDIFEAHSEFWNKNIAYYFVAVCDKKTYIINSKVKPNAENPVSQNIQIASFDHGINSEGYEKDVIKEITKDYIDSTYFYDFIIKNRKIRQEIEVDKDLLLNLIALRNNLLDINNEEVIHLLILRCIFIKYLEDREIYPKGYLVSLLNTSESNKLIDGFNEISKINGDIFRYDSNLSQTDIKPYYLSQLSLFFNSDYRTGQLKLFPYQFDKIPVQLISHVYEAFLRSEDKKGKGIYYTPAFVVNFMLSHTLVEKLKENRSISVLDPAVGSGAFLVESFRAIINSFPQKPTFEQKKEILEKQLFGIDIDAKALQIAAFSLYLVLLENEDTNFLKDKIENSNPILPSLIGINLVSANALTDDVFEDRTFDCIVSNPPWGSVEENEDLENIKERKAIGNKGKTGDIKEYIHVADYERSQAFLMRVKKWSNENSILTLIVKNSIFLNDNSEEFRKDLLRTYQLSHFYELSNYNKIIFKKQIIGKINGQDIETGASEPCAILILKIYKSENSLVKYISPKLTPFGENFHIIHSTKKDKNEIEQNRFIEDDLLWRVLVNGDLEDYFLLKNKLFSAKKQTIECRSGFKATTNMKAVGDPDYRKLIEPTDFLRYKLIRSPKLFNFNQEMERKRAKEIFEGKRILFPNRPLKQDKYKLKCIVVNENEIHKDNISCIRIKNENNSVDISSYLALFNSSTIGYQIYNISSQWDTGDEKRDKIKNSDAERVALPILNNNHIEYLNSSIRNIIEFNNSETENIIDEYVYGLYNLKEYEKEIIREFYQIKVERTGNKQFVNKSDIERYSGKFTELFKTVLSVNRNLKASFHISSNIGTIVCFRIEEENTPATLIEDQKLEILNFVKRKQLQQVDVSKILNEEKVKIYDGKNLYIIKSNFFKDWTVRQAIKDAKEEIANLLSKLPDSDGR